MLIVAMFGVAAWRWPLTGNNISVHWNASGDIDRYGGKLEGLLALPLTALGIYALMVLLPRLDPGRANDAQFGKVYNAIRLAMLAFFAIVHGAMLLTAAGYKIEIFSLVFGAMGVLFIVLGGAMGKIRPNWFVGIRTPWTLSSKTAWIKTHHVGGWTFIIVGAMFIGTGFAAPSASAIILVVMVSLEASLGLWIYSYLVWRDADDKAPPADTLLAVD